MDNRICPNCGESKWYYAEYCRKCRFELIPKEERLEWGKKMLERNRAIGRVAPAPWEGEKE